MEIKKTFHDMFAFRSNISPHIEHIAKIKYKHEEKNKIKCEGPTNKSTKTPECFWNFRYQKGARLAKHQTRKTIKIMARA